MRFIFLLFTMLFSFFIHPEGFIGDTQVLTQDGYVQIKTLKAGDSVVCFDMPNSFVVGTISGAKKHSAQQAVILSVGQEKIIAAKGQKFFNAKSTGWIDAEKIVAGDKLLSLDGVDVVVDSVEDCNEYCELYKISVDDYNNFFVTSKNLLVHNANALLANPVVREAVVYAYENLPELERMGVAAIELLRATGLAKNEKNPSERRVADDPKQNQNKQESSGGGGGSDKPPEKKPDEEPKRQIKAVNEDEILEKEKNGGHIFGQEKHRFEEFGIKKGSDKAEDTLRKIIDKVVDKDKQGGIQSSQQGVFETQVDNVVCGRPVKVRGRIMDGDLKVGTAYIPKGIK